MPANQEVTRFLNAWFSVRQLIQSANFNHFHKAGLSATQFMTLNLLPKRGKNIAIGELAKQMSLKPATVAKTVDSLEARRMLVRAKSTTDGRLVLVQITKLGTTFQNSAQGQFRNYIADIFDEMQRPDRTALINGLECLVLAAESLHSPSTDDHAATPAKRNSRKSRTR